jgi:hypothetical protein
MVTVAAYEDFRVNSHEKLNKTTGQWEPINPEATEHWYTDSASITLPGDKGSIGRIDHYMKTSIKGIVNAYVKQVVLREGRKGIHTLSIDVHTKDADYRVDQKKSIKIEITA